MNSELLRGIAAADPTLLDLRGVDVPDHVADLRLSIAQLLGNAETGAKVDAHREHLRGRVAQLWICDGCEASVADDLRAEIDLAAARRKKVLALPL